MFFSLFNRSRVTGPFKIDWNSKKLIYFYTCALKILHLLYDADVLSESAILAWADEKDGADEKDLIFLKKAAPFVRWLREAESETEDDESSDED